eukprot:3086127-Alexandrium_andersonii.AAC.1
MQFIKPFPRCCFARFVGVSIHPWCLFGSAGLHLLFGSARAGTSPKGYNAKRQCDGSPGSWLFGSAE